jgi:peptidoglycan/xylan/chitin deacetylase (PgdA/CDA1 family)
MRWFILWCSTATALLAVAMSVWQGVGWLGLLVLPLFLVLWASLYPGCRWWGPVMTEFPTRRREALLTFDLAPHAEETPLVLDLLDTERATALFFVTGEQVLRHPELVKLILARGHALGLNGMSYQSARFWCWLPQRLRGEVAEGLEVLQRLVPDYKVQWFRAPGGRCNPWLHGVLAERGLQLMAWSASDGYSRASDFDSIVIQMRRDINQGAIIALHHGMRDRSGQPVVPDLVRELLLWLHGQGYRFEAED